MMRRAQLRMISGVALIAVVMVVPEWDNAALAAKAHNAGQTASVPILVSGRQHNTRARLTFIMDGTLDMTVRQTPEGVELRSEGNAAYQLAKLPKLREVSAIDVRTEGGATIALIHLTGTCKMQQERVGNKVTLYLADTGPRQKEVSEAPAPGPTPAPPAPAAKTAMEGLMDGLREKLALLNGQLPPAASPSRVGAAARMPEVLIPAGEAAQPSAPIHRSSCAPDFTMSGWKGDEPFPQRLEALRALTAQSREAPPAMATLAEFYLGNGLGAEALAVTLAVKQDDISPEERRRLLRDADLARLLKAQPIDSTSPLLNGADGCDPTDAPLWRVLSAVASGDQEIIRRDGEAAGENLKSVPEPISSLIAYNIAEAAGDDLPILRAMAAAVHNSDAGEQIDAAGRFALQARMARARKDPIDEVSFLERAIGDIGVTGLRARVRLAEIRSADDNDEGRKSELILADAARVYRDTAFGQAAATALSEQRLRHGDFAGALRVANDSASGHSPSQNDSRSAALAARVLRQLLVEKDPQNLPSPEQRLLIYWHYSGYATPGEKGDDIRMGAAELMLDQGMPEAALDVVRQLSSPAAQSARGALLHAIAEARAGDADAALTLLKTVPRSDESQRAGADAFVRLGKPVEAAHQLDGLKEASDRARRAALLYDGKEWSDAADAYAVVLRDGALAKEARDEAADRYALALALSGKQPAQGLSGFTGLAELVIGALPGQTDAQQQPVAAIRGSLRRAGQIEALLPPSGPAATPTNGG